jgi:hypothetical protein
MMHPHSYRRNLPALAKGREQLLYIPLALKDGIGKLLTLKAFGEKTEWGEIASLNQPA